MPALGNQTGKTFVITDCTSGCGYEAKKLLLSQCARVIMKTKLKNQRYLMSPSEQILQLSLTVGL